MRTLQDLSLELERVRGILPAGAPEVDDLLYVVSSDLRTLRKYRNPPQWIIDRAWAALQMIVELIEAATAISHRKRQRQLDADRELADDEVARIQESERMELERARAARLALILAFREISKEPCIQPIQPVKKRGIRRL